jgi:hypothetical protein
MKELSTSYQLETKNLKPETTILGMQARRTRPETSLLTWIPALRAGMTQSSGAA